MLLYFMVLCAVTGNQDSQPNAPHCKWPYAIGREGCPCPPDNQRNNPAKIPSTSSVRKLIPDYNCLSEYIMRNAGLEEAQVGIKIARRNINNLRYADDTTLMAESEEELKSLLMKMKEDSENVDLKLNIQKTKIMASGPITSLEIDGETVETVSDFILGGSKITADGDYSHEIKIRKVLNNLDSILKSRDITLPTKVRWSRLWFFQWSCMDVRVGL